MTTRWARVGAPLNDRPALVAVSLAAAPHLVGTDSELITNLALDVVLDNRVHGEFGTRVDCELRGELPMLIRELLHQLRNDPSVAQFALDSIASLFVEGVAELCALLRDDLLAVRSAICVRATIFMVAISAVIHFGVMYVVFLPKRRRFRKIKPKEYKNQKNKKRENTKRNYKEKVLFFSVQKHTNGLFKSLFLSSP